MQVFFRVDASLTAGLGHVMRCLTLAQELRKHGATVSFISREHPGNLCGLIEERGFSVSRLPEPATDMVFEDTPVHAAWLGTSWQEDARQTLVILDTTAEKPDWLVVDHYAIDQRWETAIAPSVARMMVIDDLADRPHACGLLLDQNLVADFDARYTGKVPATCTLLLGPKYALLQPDYAELHEADVAPGGPIRRIFVFFGGADERNLTGRSLSAFLVLGKSDIEVDVVISSGSPHASAIRRQIQGHRNIHLHSNLHSLAPLMRQANLAIGAGGTTSWERLCLGLPALVVTLADNQLPIAAELNLRRLIRWLGHQDDVTEADFSQALRELLAQPSLQSEFSSGTQVVDGKGAHRVWAAMVAVSASNLRARKATLADESLLLEWANDPTTRANGFSRAQITPQAHGQWFRSRVNNSDDCHLYIVEIAVGEAIGQVRFERAEATWVIGYSLAPVFRGRGLGRHLLDAALLQLRKEECDPHVIGEVKTQNLASRRVFESLGFSAFCDDGDTVKYTRTIKSA